MSALWLRNRLLEPSQQLRVTSGCNQVSMAQKSGAFGEKVRGKLIAHFTGAPGDGAALDATQASAECNELKLIKEEEGGDPCALTLGVRTKLGGGIADSIGEVSAGAKELPAVLQALENLFRMSWETRVRQACFSKPPHEFVEIWVL